MKSLFDRLRPYRWAAVAILVAVLVLRGRLNHNRPETVLELPSGTKFVKVKDGRIYMARINVAQVEVELISRPGSTRKIPVLARTASANGMRSAGQSAMHPAQDGSVRDAFPDIMSLLVAPVTGGKEQSVGLNTVEAADETTLWKTDTGIVQAFIQKPAHLTLPMAGAGGGGPPSSSVLTAPPIPPFHIESVKQTTQDITLILRQCSGGTGPLTPLRTIPVGTILQGADLDFQHGVAVVKGWIYWIQYAPDEVRIRVSANHQTTPLSDLPRCAIMTAPLSGGVPRKLLDRISEDTQLIASTEGILCRTPVPETDSKVQAGFSHRITFLSAELPSHPVIDTHNASEYAVMNGSFVWLEDDRAASAASPRVQKRLMQVNLDGTGLRQLPTTSPTAAVGSTITHLDVYNGRLYVTMAAERKPAAGETNRSRYILYRLRAGAKPTLEKVFEEPDHSGYCSYDGEYAYCVATEEREDMTDFSAAGLLGKRVETLYRYPLPK